MRRRVHSLACLLVVLIFGGLLFAQSDRATITGTVKDASSAVLPGVQVQIKNVGTNDVMTATTDNLGNFRVGNLPIGSYAITFSKDGFKTLDRKGLTLLISQVAEINATLQVGGKTEVIEVTDAAPVLQTEDAQVSTNITNEAMSELPMNAQGSRNLSNFAFNSVPGVEGSDYSTHINGSMALSKEVMIDGTSAVSQLGGYISESQPPMEAIQEFETDTAGIGGNEGRSGGGVFRYEMKSGANKIHGSLFGILHSTDLDSLSAQNHESAITDPANAKAYLTKYDSMSDWGGSFGGAIVKDKLFYFFSFERYMQSMWGLGANTRTVPTDAMMGLNSDGSVAPYADLSGALNTSAAPIATDACNNPVYQGAIYQAGNKCVYVNNQIPTNLISKTSAKVLQLFHQYYKPESTLTANDAGPSYNPDPWFHNTQTSVKIDYNLSSKNRINGSYYFDDYPRINADQGGAWSPTAKDGGVMANSYNHNTTAPGIRLSDTYTFSPRVLNTVHATLNRFRNPSDAVTKGGAWDTYLGLPAGAGNFPLIVFSSGMYTSGANYQGGWNISNIGSEYNDFYAGNTYIYNDELDLSLGRHTFKFGAEFRAQQFNEHPDEQTFNNITFDPSTNGVQYNATGSAFGAFLLGNVYQATPTVHDPEYGRRKEFSWYVVDDWKVTPRLSMNLSLRWDYNNPYKEKFGHWSSFETQDFNPVTKLMGQYEYLGGGTQSFEKHQDMYNYAPHVGAAYKLTDKTVIRANFSVFYVPLNMNTWGGVPYQQTGNPGYFPASVEHNFNWDNGYNGTVTELHTPDYQQWGYVSIDPHSLTPGNTQQYTFGVQREISRDTKVDVSWIQSHSYHLQSGALKTNQPTIANYKRMAANAGCIGGDPTYNYAGAGDQCYFPYPQVKESYGELFSVGSPLGNGDYKSLQINVTKRASHGLTVQGSYNWSRAHGDVDSTMGETWSQGSIQNIYDLKNEAKDISDFDVTHIVKGYATYELPFGHGKMFFSGANTVANKFVSGWSLTGNFHYNTGGPLWLHAPSAPDGFASLYMNIVPGCKLTLGKPRLNQDWLNRACFTIPAAGTLGNGGDFMSQIRYPGLATEDMGLHKAVAFGPEDRVKLNMHVEFFNVFNRHNLSGPDTAYNLKPNTTYGDVLSYGQGGRIGQFGARITF